MGHHSPSLIYFPTCSIAYLIDIRVFLLTFNLKVSAVSKNIRTQTSQMALLPTYVVQVVHYSTTMHQQPWSIGILNMATAQIKKCLKVNNKMEALTLPKWWLRYDKATERKVWTERHVWIERCEAWLKLLPGEQLVQQKTRFDEVKQHRTAGSCLTVCGIGTSKTLFGQVFGFT